jgi:hypothetical protein
MTFYRYIRIISPLGLFKLLIFKLVSLIVNNKEVIFILLLLFTFLILSLEHVYNFFLNNVIISEDCFRLNITGGESSSQGSSQPNISDGGSSSNNPQPNSNPDPGRFYSGPYPNF